MTSNLELALLISASTRGFDAFNKAQSEIGGIKGAVEGAKALNSTVGAVGPAARMPETVLEAKTLL